MQGVQKQHSALSRTDAHSETAAQSSTTASVDKTFLSRTLAKLWENSAGPNWRKYRKYLIVFPFVVYKDRKTEQAYAKSVKETYQLRSPIAGIATILVLLPMWLIPSRMMRMELDANSLNGLLACVSPLHRVLYDVFMVCSIACGVILCLHNELPFTRWWPEESFLVLGSFPFFAVIMWLLCCLISGYKSRDEFKVGGTQAADGAIQFKFWTDCLLLVAMFMMFVFFDLLQNTRTMYTLWLHILVVGTYIGSRVFIMIIFRNPDDDDFIPLIIVALALQCVFYLALVLMVYFSRCQKEVAERCAYLDILFDQERLRELRKAQSKKRSKAQTLQEKIIDAIRKAQTGLQVAAFERSTQGEVVLLERDEILRQAAEIAMDSDDLFAVGARGGADDDDGLANMYTRHRGGEGGASQQRKTGEDKLCVPFDQQEFFTAEVLPDVSQRSEYERSVGVAPGTSFKILELAEKDPHILVKTALTLMEPVEDELQIPRTILTKYFYQIERKYAPNPYHNATHGAMVGHMSIAILKSLGLHQYFSKPSLLHLTIAALGHDVGHPGFNNNYLVNSQSVLGRLYNDVAVLENYHSFLVFRFAQISNEVNIFQNLPENEWRELRQNIIDLILITDMSQHFAVISKFRVRRTSDKFDPKQNVEDQEFIMKMAIKMADLSHAAVEWTQHLEWSFRVTREFYLQGDQEKASKLPVSPLCDSATHPDFAKSQAGFLQFVVTPLATELAEVDETGLFNNDFMNKLLFNKHKWELLREKRDPLPIPSNVDKLECARPQFAEGTWFLALRSKTVDDINTNPFDQPDVVEFLGNQGGGAEGDYLSGESASEQDGEKRADKASGSSSAASGSSSGDSSGSSGDESSSGSSGSSSDASSSGGSSSSDSDSSGSD